MVEHHEGRAAAAESSLKFYQQRRKAAAAPRHNEEYVEYVRVPRRGNDWTTVYVLSFGFSLFSACYTKVLFAAHQYFSMLLCFFPFFIQTCDTLVCR